MNHISMQNCTYKCSLTSRRAKQHELSSHLHTRARPGGQLRGRVEPAHRPAQRPVHGRRRARLCGQPAAGRLCVWSAARSSSQGRAALARDRAPPLQAVGAERARARPDARGEHRARDTGQGSLPEREPQRPLVQRLPRVPELAARLRQQLVQPRRHRLVRPGIQRRPQQAEAWGAAVLRQGSGGDRRSDGARRGRGGAAEASARAVRPLHRRAVPSGRRLAQPGRRSQYTCVLRPSDHRRRAQGVGAARCRAADAIHADQRARLRDGGCASAAPAPARGRAPRRGGSRGKAPGGLHNVAPQAKRQAPQSHAAALLAPTYATDATASPPP